MTAVVAASQLRTAQAYWDEASLLAEANLGSALAVASLYGRYEPVARRLARLRGARADEVDDVVAEAFARIVARFRVGGGPTVAFAPYLAATVNSAWVDMVRKNARCVSTDDPQLEQSLDPVQDATADLGDRLTIIAAFRQLPPRWQSVLWLSAVEGRTMAEVGAVLGLSANAATQLGHRAREALRTNYLLAHLLGSEDPRCRRALRALPAYVRGRARRTQRGVVESHLLDCPACTAAAQDLAEVNKELGRSLLPALGDGANALAPLVQPPRAAGAGALSRRKRRGR